MTLVTVDSFANRDWDTHANNFKDLKEKLLPDTDRALAALLEDLECRGLLEETLVVWMGDMGRTPRINAAAGRDHWSFSTPSSWPVAGFAGTGPRLIDARDLPPPTRSPRRHHHDDPSFPGIDHRTQIVDQQGRPS